MAVSPREADPARVSAIVTTRNSERTLEACLASIRAQSYPDVEIVVVDNASTDATPQIAERYCDVFETKGPERSAQRNYAAELSSGRYLVFIDSDMVLDQGVISDGVQAIRADGVRGVMIPEMSFGDDFWTRCRILERACYTGDDTVEAARMYRRSDFFDVGGFDLELNGPEDWDLSRRITGGTTVPRTSSIIHHDEGRTTLRGSFVKRRYYAPGYLRYLKKHRGGVVAQANSVFRPAFVRHWKLLGRHPLLTVGMFTLKSVELGAVLQVAAEQYVLRRTPDRFTQVYRSADPSPGGLVPLMVTFGSVEHPDGGVQTRSRFTAEVFAEIGVAPKVVSTLEPGLGQTPTWARSLRSPPRKPFKGFSAAFVRLIRGEAAQSSVVVITNAMFLPALAAARVKLPLIWDTNECQTLHYARLPPTASNRLKHAAWSGLERWAVRRCSVAIAIGEEEAAIWRSAYPGLGDRLAVVDHAPLAAARRPDEARRMLAGLSGRSLDGPVLLFLGTLRAKHNAAAARWILDELVDSLPHGATMVFCGPGSEELVAGLPPNGVVVGLGTVEDVDSVVAAADLCLAPLAAGAGVKTKVLHYLAHGKRIAGTPLAFEGVADAPGLYPASLDDLPALVGRLCDAGDPSAAAEERSQAQAAWLETYHGRAHVVEQWKKVLACLPTSSRM